MSTTRSDIICVFEAFEESNVVHSVSINIYEQTLQDFIETFIQTILQITARTLPFVRMVDL